MIVILVIALTFVALYIAGEIYRRADYRERFKRMHGTLADVEESFVENAEGHDLYSVRLQGDTGIRVTGFMKVPADTSGPFPSLLILGGLRTGRRTLDYIHNTRGVILLALDYPYEGKRTQMSAGEFLSSIPLIRRAVIETVPGAMLAADYLLTRDDIDPDRIVAVGGSLGAFFIPAMMAVDERPAAAVMLFGAGDIQSILRAALDLPGIIAAPAGWLGAVLVSPVEPLKYVADVSPRPLFMLNGTGDPRMPERCSRLLYDAAGEPKTIHWIDAGHVTIRDKEFHKMVSDELVTWLVDQDLVPPGSYIEAE
jgi:hypothetical protein